jgi:hypothetical protein
MASEFSAFQTGGQRDLNFHGCNRTTRPMDLERARRRWISFGGKAGIELAVVENSAAKHWRMAEVD